MNLLFAKVRCVAPPTLLSVALAIVCSGSTGAQSYSEDRLTAGQRLHASGNYQQAIIEFSLACISTLDRPVEYGRCKTLLFLSQIGDRQRVEARSTLLLIARIEQDQRAFSTADLGSQVRQLFLGTVLQDFSSENFSQSPRFSALLEAARAQQLPEQSHQSRSLAELKAHAAANPNDLRALERLTERLYRQRKVADASKRSDSLVSAEPTNATGRCIQATTRAARNRSLCASYLPAIDECSQSLRTAFYVETVLQCHLDLESYNEGRDFLSTLTAQVKSTSKVTGLARKITKRADPPSFLDIQSANQTASTETAAQPKRLDASAVTPTAAKEQILDRQIIEHSQELERAGDEAVKNRDRPALLAIQEQVRRLADQHQSIFQPQRVAGKFGYVLRDWAATVKYIRRAQGFGSTSANLTFYLAVAYYELGDRASAETAMRDSLERNVRRSDLVKAYEEKILGSAP